MTGTLLVSYEEKSQLPVFILHYYFIYCFTNYWEILLTPTQTTTPFLLLLLSSVPPLATLLLLSFTKWVLFALKSKKTFDFKGF